MYHRSRWDFREYQRAARFLARHSFAVGRRFTYLFQLQEVNMYSIQNPSHESEVCMPVSTRELREFRP